jgi:hypothetical protein
MTKRSEKLLGIMINNELTWKEQLYVETRREEDKSPGLISQPFQRVGILRRLSKCMSKSRVRITAEC